MDQAVFRKLCIDAIEGRLDEPTRQKWEALRLSDPEFADFHARLAMAHNRLSSRLTSTPPRQPPATPSRLFWVLAPLFGAISALSGGLGMDAWIRHGQQQQLDAASLQLPPYSPRANAPIAVPPRNEPAPQPGPEPKPTPEPLPLPEPDPDPAPEPGPEPWFVVAAASDQDARILRPGATEYAEAPAGIGLWGGTTVRVGRGDLRLRSDDAALTLSGRGELEISGPRSLRLLRGRLVLRVLADGFSLECDGTSLGLAAGDYICNNLRGLSELAVLAGRVEAARESERASVGRSTLLALSRGLQESALSGDALKTLRAEAATGVDRKLHWHFEAGPGDCNEGVVIANGLDGGASLQHDTIRPGVGTSRYEPLFAAEPGLRLRLWVRTDAASIAVAARVHLPQGLRNVSMKVALPPGAGWRMVDVSLAGLLAGPKCDQPGWVEGANYSGLQFSVPPQETMRLTSYALTIDEVEIYIQR